MLQLSRLRNLGAVFVLVLAACASDPTASQEYQDLETRLETAESDLTATQSDLSDVRAELDDVRAELEDAEASLSAADATAEEAAEEISSLEEALAAAEAALEASVQEVGTWPAPMRQGFIDACAAEPDPTLTEEQNLALCTCMADNLEQTVSLEDLLALGLSIEAEVDPTTGLPAGMDERLAAVFLTAAFTCFVALEN